MTSTPQNRESDIAAQFAELAPWVFQFRIRRADYGLEVPSLFGFKIQDTGVIEFELTLQRKGAAALAQPPSTLRPGGGVPNPGGAEPGAPSTPPCTAGGRLPGGPGRLVYAARSDQSDDLFTIDASGKGLRQLTDQSGGQLEPTWSPDGSQIAFRSFRDGNSEVYVMNADGSEQTNLTNDPALDNAPAWSPDGTKLAFTTDRDGDFEIYRMDADGANKVNLTQNPAFDERPDWQSTDASSRR